MIATFEALVATYSGFFSVALVVKIVVSVGVTLDRAVSIWGNKLPKNAISGGCGNLFGNQCDLAGIQRGHWRVAWSGDHVTTACEAWSGDHATTACHWRVVVAWSGDHATTACGIMPQQRCRPGPGLVPA